MLSDTWPGLEEFFAPGQEILFAENADDVLDALQLSDHELSRIAGAARERTLREHTAAARAEQLEEALSRALAEEALGV
jgi:spore maturation protein CgeB